MAEYHVGCGAFSIYAGTLNKKGDMWLHKSDVTEEAIKAVMGHMYYKSSDGENAYAYAAKLKNGKYVRLKLEVSDDCPEWAKDVLDGEDGERHDIDK